MSRKLRSYAPGAVFHLTARGNNKEAFFDEEIRNACVCVIRDAVNRTDLELIAWAIMTNHLHLIVRQADRPLSAFMQPICRRIARRVHKHLKREGHIFGRPYREKRIADVFHLRNAIDYVHYNPVEATICKTTDEYAWSSCGLYTGASRDHCPPNQPHVTTCLEIFATRPNRTLEELQGDYRAFAAWRMECRSLPEDVPSPRGPAMVDGERNWVERFGTLSQVAPVRSRDLRDIVRDVIAEIAPGLPLELLQMRRGGEAITAIRREVVRRAMPAGHRGVVIARYLNISSAAVSRIASQLFGRHILPQGTPNSP